MYEARFYTKTTKNRLVCSLCPNSCVINEGESGICSVRKNIGGKLMVTNYQKYAAIALDPIEKKPLYHFYPGKSILSVGSVGCNMHCEWCQNCEISQKEHFSDIQLKQFSPEDLLKKALMDPGNIGIAYTYNEPGISFETIIESARLFREKGLKNVMVTNGYINKQALNEMLDYTDAVNLDIKSFNEVIHKKYTGARLDHILENAKEIFERKVHLELTFLVVSGINDLPAEFVNLLKWIKKELSVDIPLHISRYFPRNKYLAPATSADLLNSFGEMAARELKYVYLGNIINREYTNTYCGNCNSLVIERMGYTTDIVGAEADGSCLNCGQKVFISG